MSLAERGIENEQRVQAPTCVVIGSFRFNRQINATIDQLEANGIRVLSPAKGTIVHEELGVKVLEGEEDRNLLTVEADFISKMFQADYAYIVNPRGYIGIHASEEIKIAIYHGIPVYSMAPVRPKYKRRLESCYADAIKVIPVNEFASAAVNAEIDIRENVWCQLFERVDGSNEEALEMAKIILYSDNVQRMTLEEKRGHISARDNPQNKVLYELLGGIPYKWMEYSDNARSYAIYKGLWFENIYLPWYRQKYGE